MNTELLEQSITNHIDERSHQALVVESEILKSMQINGVYENHGHTLTFESVMECMENTEDFDASLKKLYVSYYNDPEALFLRLHAMMAEVNRAVAEHADTLSIKIVNP